MHVAKFTTGYMDNAIFDLVDTVDMAVAQLTPHLDKFDTIVGTGFSGGMVIPMLATMLDKKFVLIRKETDDSHHGQGRLLGELGERWIFVDDFCQSGRTKNRVIEKTRQAAEREYHVTTYVGNYYYGGYRLSSDYREGGEIQFLPEREQIEMGREFKEEEIVEPKFYRDFGRSFREARERQLEAYNTMALPEFEFRRYFSGGVNPGAFVEKPAKEEPLAEWERELLKALDVPTEDKPNSIAEVLHLKKSKKPAFARFTQSDFRKRA